MSWPPAGAVRVDTLIAGERFREMDGNVYEYIRRDGALDGVHHVECTHTIDAASRSRVFAGCASVQVLPQREETPAEAHANEGGDVARDAQRDRDDRDERRHAR